MEVKPTITAVEEKKETTLEKPLQPEGAQPTIDTRADNGGEKRGRKDGSVYAFRLPVGPLLRVWPQMSLMLHSVDETKALTLEETQERLAAAMADGTLAAAFAEGKGTEFMASLAEKDISEKATLGQFRKKYGEYFQVGIGRGAFKAAHDAIYEERIASLEKVHHAGITSEENDIVLQELNAKKAALAAAQTAAPVESAPEAPAAPTE